MTFHAKRKTQKFIKRACNHTFFYKKIISSMEFCELNFGLKMDVLYHFQIRYVFNGFRIWQTGAFSKLRTDTMGRMKQFHILEVTPRLPTAIYRAFYSACGEVCNGFPPFWHFFYYIRLFRAPRRFLGAIKIATESWECILSDSKVWSTDFDRLGNLSMPFASV